MDTPPKAPRYYGIPLKREAYRKTVKLSLKKRLSLPSKLISSLANVGRCFHRYDSFNFRSSMLLTDIVQHVRL
jgi:hypothetical protein